MVDNSEGHRTIQATVFFFFLRQVAFLKVASHAFLYLDCLSMPTC